MRFCSTEGIFFTSCPEEGGKINWPRGTVQVLRFHSAPNDYGFFFMNEAFNRFNGEKTSILFLA